MILKESKLKGVFENESPAGRKFVNERSNLNSKFRGSSEQSKIFTKIPDEFPKENVYGERIIKNKDGFFREWDAQRSKLGAAIKKGINQIAIKPGSFVLYLGAASGTTVSHVSDIIGIDGFVYALDFSPRVVRDLYFLCKKRNNLAPLLESAKTPEDYEQKLSDVDVVFQDIAQRDQIKIFLKNCSRFLKEGGFGVLSLKARSIDVTKKPVEIFKKARELLEKEMILVDYKTLDPYEKDHCFFVLKKKQTDQ